MADDIVRHVLPEDFDALEDTLVDAFRDDPWMQWMCPGPEGPEFCRRWMRLGLEIGLPHGHTYSVRADRSCAIWAPPAVDLFGGSAGEKIGTLLTESLGDRVGPVFEGLMSIGGNHPEEPHFYLFTLGTATAEQGKGAGALLMDQVLRQCDRQQMGAYLESSNGRNVPFYERHGFKVLKEIALSEEAIIRPMWRDPQ